MTEVLPVAATAVLGYFIYQNWANQPDNFNADRTQAVGSSPATKATTDANVYTSAYLPNTIDARDSQVPNPHLRARQPRVPHSRGSIPYYQIEPNSSFEIKGVDSDISETFAQVHATSADWLKNHPAPVPFSPQKHFSGRVVPMVDVRGRAQQYLAAATATQLAPSSFSLKGGGPARRHPITEYTDHARAIKSAHAGALLPGTKPPVAIHPQSAHYATSPFTRIYTGRHPKVTV